MAIVASATGMVMRMVAWVATVLAINSWMAITAFIKTKATELVVSKATAKRMAIQVTERVSKVTTMILKVIMETSPKVTDQAVA